MNSSCVIRLLDASEIATVKWILGSHEIPHVIQNEHTVSVSGTGYDAPAEVWVPDESAERARELILGVIDRTTRD